MTDPTGADEAAARVDEVLPELLEALPHEPIGAQLGAERFVADIREVFADRKRLLAEVDRLTRQCKAATAGTDRVAARAINLRAERNQALAHLRRLVDPHDDACHFGDDGLCQTHLIDGSEPGKCGVVEARQFVAETDAPATDVPAPAAGGRHRHETEGDG